ncbi:MULTISPECIES: CopG family transcriptional regulator [Sphingobium]|uniref:Ribbon-helix-helix domain-containing protein n=1 Tax=Sphingobium yanoikuyae TaxID=13690 RepID=A0AA43B9T4_SPHYA|nr:MULTISPECIES: CopG family transcriptional regulator [Sphingobium]MBS50964.1 CopG family transcriptional regulator [Sphingobium sp.]MCC4256843.1 ribbon-helix-helix domain-containing protein [Sphingobium lactosutens]MDH2133771.1 ribbon-helix-helix domain-containing protein [Sphingobium yanoikuyae]MDH2150663.1 ribbon-helix-helix domain-containing protein [Sphingobium yanoikuyae]MDH2169432.1 ribbon-helix-helix domain-containing protein [Sphingobium yanoikuyae]
MKPRHHLYLDEELTARLDMLASTPGTSKSAIISDALREYLNRRATREVDDLLKHRLDRISNQLGRIERDATVLLETLSLFVRYQLTVTAPLPEADKAAQAIGRERFRRFVDQVGRQLATSRSIDTPPRDGEPS